MAETTNIEVKTPESKNSGIKRFLSVLWEFLEIVIIAALIVLPIRYFIFQPFIVKGDSMVPNFASGDYLIVDEISYKLGEPKRGDVMVFKYPLDNSQRFIKRVIGLPGEKVEIKDGKIAIHQGENTMILDEADYLPNAPKLEGNKVLELKDGEYFVMGDNRPYSYDSRSWGVLPEKDIIGKAWFRIFPISSMSFIPAESYN